MNRALLMLRLPGFERMASAKKLDHFIKRPKKRAMNTSEDKLIPTSAIRLLKEENAKNEQLRLFNSVRLRPKNDTTR